MQYPEDTNRADMVPADALQECFDLWASGAWPDEVLADGLREVMHHLLRGGIVRPL